MSKKKTICALVAGFITALGVTGQFTVSGKDTQTHRSEARIQNDLDARNTGGWYTNKALRGLQRRKRIYKYIG